MGKIIKDSRNLGQLPLFSIAPTQGSEPTARCKENEIMAQHVCKSHDLTLKIFRQNTFELAGIKDESQNVKHTALMMPRCRTDFNMTT